VVADPVPACTPLRHKRQAGIAADLHHRREEHRAHMRLVQRVEQRLVHALRGREALRVQAVVEGEGEALCEGAGGE
jgi:hypothetical protein